MPMLDGPLVRQIFTVAHTMYTELIHDCGLRIFKEKTMETTIGYWGYFEIMEKKMETTFLVYGG